MNSARKHAVVVLLLFSLAGCAPKNAKTSPPPQAQAPTTVPDAGKAGAMYPPPLTQTPSQPEPAPTTPAPQVAQAEPTPAPESPPPPVAKKTTSHKTKPSAAKSSSDGSATTASDGSTAPAATAPPMAETIEVAKNGDAPAATPIGELTPAETPEQAQKGKDTSDLISKTEDGLNAMKRQLSAPEQETVNQIRAFLTKAKTALSVEDYDGAYVLATKAKVLLDELNKT
jgi:hypothetical protein